MYLGYQVGLIVSFLIGALLIYQNIATKLDDRKYPPTGQLIDVGGYKLHLHTQGEGDVTVVLDAGLSGTSIGWCLVQSKVAEFTRVCSFDRAGYAWSEPSPKKRDSCNLAKELHTLLEKAKIPGPYLLVGHSFGGCNALLFADLYPEETLGVILVDSVQEDMPRERVSLLSLKSLVSAVGISRLRGASNEILQMFAPLPKEQRAMYLAQMYRTSYARTVARELEAFNESLDQLSHSKLPLQGKPLTVITAGKFTDQAEMAHWNHLQAQLLTKSTHSKQIIAKNSDHMINHHQPKIIVEAIREMIPTSISAIP